MKRGYVFGVIFLILISTISFAFAASIDDNLPAAPEDGEDGLPPGDDGGAVCGNKIVEAGESCDDGNTENLDGCSSVCETEAGIDVYVLEPEQNACSDLSSGLLCNNTAAQNYCVTVEGYDGYVSGSMVCDQGGHGFGNLANHPINPAIGLCYNDDGSGDVRWVSSLKCFSRTDADSQEQSEDETPPFSSTCTDSDGGIDIFSEGVVGIEFEGGDYSDFTDSCSNGILTEYYCEEDGTKNSREIACPTAECVSGTGACKSTGYGNVCSADVSEGLPEAEPKTRAKNNVDEIMYCDYDLEWKKTIATGSPTECIDDYQCYSNSCADSQCISLQQEFSAQRRVLGQIWCFITNMNDYFTNSEDIGLCNGNLECIQTSAPNYGGCLSNFLEGEQ